MGTDASAKRWTVLDLLNWTKDYFSRSELESPRLAAEMLLSKALGCQRMELYTRFDSVPDQDKRTQFREMVRKAAEGEPVAYLVGKREFYSLPLKVTPDVLIPRPETEILVDLAIDRFRKMKSPAIHWDICTGSGAVAIAVAANTPAEVSVLATDISEAAIAIATENATEHNLCQRVTLAQADLFNLPDSTGDQDAKFDVITANPPYIRSADMASLSKQVKREPAGALDGGSDGLDLVRRIIADASTLLSEEGILAMEIGYDQADEVWDIINANPAYSNARFVKDSAGIDRVLLASRA